MGAYGCSQQLFQYEIWWKFCTRNTVTYFGKGNRCHIRKVLHLIFKCFRKFEDWNAVGAAFAISFIAMIKPKLNIETYPTGKRKGKIGRSWTNEIQQSWLLTALPTLVWWITEAFGLHVAATESTGKHSVTLLTAEKKIYWKEKKTNMIRRRIPWVCVWEREREGIQVTDTQAS